MILKAMLRVAIASVLVSCAMISAAIAGTATHLSVQLPNPVGSYTNNTLTVTALDAGNETDTTYNGTVALTSSDPGFVNLGPFMLTSGVGDLNFILKTAGTQSVTATDTSVASITGTISTLVVPGPTTRFIISAPADVTPGAAFNITVTAFDLYGNTTTDYAGTVHFTSSDGSAVLPADSTLTAGVGTFSVTLNTKPTQSITATDTVDNSITGSTGNITTPVRLQSFSVD